MRRLVEVLFALMVITPAIAGERDLSGSEIVARLADRSLYAENVEQIFQQQGLTFYLENGSSSQGTWWVAGDLYCSTWPPNPAETCFTVLQDGEMVIFVSKTGARFPMRTAK